MAFSRDDADEILSGINEPALTDIEFEGMDTDDEIYSQLSLIIQELRGGVGSAYQKLAKDAKKHGVILGKKEYSNILIGLVVE
ncbi:MAG: hypothetical protein LBV16_09345 [Elusimicrobiota bacterium]|jgi:hypothetical protein|nr:hypothetical protein [Elusimicrobiota bacterium]